ncbi:MAG: hypothetical protein JXA97_06310 [Anaerolineales bacterium]|nr:hypothetical protein [Anaerolineales bacterium]
MTFSIELLERHPSVAILQHVQADGGLWGTRGRRVLFSEDGRRWKQVASFPSAFPRDAFGFSRITARAMRADKANYYVNARGKSFGIRSGQVYRLNDSHALEPWFSIQGDSVLHGGICEDEDGWTYFGEYFMNPDRGEVRIWRLSPDLTAFEAAATFPAGMIRHVHGIYRDPYHPNDLWATVGDYEGECYFFRSKDRFQNMDQFGNGGQLWRAVRLFFTRDHITWLTDSHLEQNYACRMKRGEGVLEMGMPLPGSGWYGIATQDGFYVAFTTVEPGPAIQRMESLILISCDGFTWQEAKAYRKDIWRPMKVFKYGVISAPTGNLSSDSLWMSGEGLVGLDGVSAHFRIKEQGAG